MSSLIPHDYRYKISSPTPVDKEPLFINEINFGYDSHEEEMQEIQSEIRRMRKELGLKDSKWF